MPIDMAARHTHRPMRSFLIATCVFLPACAANNWDAIEADSRGCAGDEISVCGRLFHTGTRVVLWSEPGGYDAYSDAPAFPDELRGWSFAPGRRYSTRRTAPAVVKASGVWHIQDLQAVVDQFVIHYDVCGTSRQCFRVLHDLRKLSVHFLLDVDGTIYQTLDLAERAWHGTRANDRSVGIEIAHIGAYPRAQHRALLEWYRVDENGPYVRFPKRIKNTGVRTPNFVARPSRAELVAGNIQGQDLWQYDFTDQQYAALAKLTAALAKIFPRLRVDYPRTPEGQLRTTALGDDEFRQYSGLIGHYHVQTNKTDPGPAFDWDRLLCEVRQ
jgi:N-acetyl-anhydromuramyl-L-alanine amidase AmpD